MVKQFTDFPNVGIIRTGDLPVGTRDGQNAQFDFPGVGIQDVDGNFIVGWNSVGTSARNYLVINNAISGQHAGITTDGSDANVGLYFAPKGSGGFRISTTNTANFVYNNSGIGNVAFNFGGYFSLNGTWGVNGVSNDPTLTENSSLLLPTQQAVKAYVDSSAPTANQTFVTNTNETATLPNSQPLSLLSTGFATVTTTTGILGSRIHTGTSNQITVTNGSGAAGNPVYSLPSAIITPGSLQTGSTFNIGGSGATVTSISTDGTLAANSDTLLSTQKAIKTYVDNTETTSNSYSYITKTDNTASLPNSVPLSGIATGFLANTTGTGLLTPRTMTGTANQISVANGDGSGTPTFSLPSTLIAPGTFQATTSINIGGSGATVTSISTDGTLAGNSDTLLSTQKATKTYIDTTETAIKSYSFITKTDNTANLPNSIPLSSLSSGFLSNTTSTGVLNPRTHTGTANQIDISNGNGVSGNPTYTLSSTMVAPGTLNVSSTFTVGGTVSIDSISNSASASSATQLMTANATQMAIASQISGAKSFRGGYDASTNLFPSTGGSGLAGAIQAGDVWEITVTGTLGGTDVYIGNTILALTNVPGQTAANWAVSVTGVASFNSRVGIIIPTSGDYSFSLISGTAAVSQGGTGNTSVGSPGTFAYSDGSKYVFSPMTVPITAGSSGTYWRSNGTNVLSSTIQVADVPTLNQNTTGQAGSVANSLTINNSGSGAASGSTYNGSSAVTISYNSIGASPLAGSSSLVTVGTITSGTWNGTTIAVANGGTGNTSVGSSGTLAQSDGSKYTFTTAAYPSTSTSGKILRGNGTDWLPTTASYPDSLGQNTLLYGSALNVVGALTAGSAAALTCNSGGTPQWKTLTDGQIIIGSTAGSPNSASLTAGTNIAITNASNSITVGLTGTVAVGNGGTGLTTAATGDLIYASATNTWAKLNASTNGYVLTLASGIPSWAAATGGGLTFNTVTSSTQAVAVNNTYYSTYAGTCVMTLPSSAAVGSLAQFITDTSHLIQIAQNSGQSIRCGAQNGVSLVTTTGTGGSITTISPNTVILLMCIVTDTTWEVIYTNNSYSGV